jgi:peptidoglycan/xylan/chitin deacetylase (PgdA/CDA1 family)
LKNQLIKSIARNIIFPLTIKLGLQKIIINRKNGVLNIYFHGVSPTDFTHISGRHMQLNQFEMLLKYLIRNFQIIDLKTSFQMQKPTNANSRLISISFDDGYYNNYKYLPELITKYKVPVTIFACGVAFEKTDYVMWTDQIALLRFFLKKDYLEIGSEIFYKKGTYDLFTNDGVSLYLKIKNMGPKTREPFLDELDRKYNIIEMAKKFDEDYWKLMNRKQILELINTGYFEIASHGMYHYNLANISEEEAKKDMNDSSSLLFNILGEKVDSISFPDGSYNETVIKNAQKSGYDKLWVSNYNSKLDKINPLLRSRFGVSSTTNYYSNIVSIYKAFKSYGI